jgi:hypothetical protein
MRWERRWGARRSAAYHIFLLDMTLWLAAVLVTLCFFMFGGTALLFLAVPLAVWGIGIYVHALLLSRRRRWPRA